ncbi:MAG TPA: response regulator [Candidatus Angelobacter sp.]|nr:response regulator [Candidatus Angelobacter sp.]
MKTILLVEDNPVDVMLMRRAMAKLDTVSDLRTVSDGQAAIDYLSGLGPYADRSSYPVPYVMVLDLKLPRKNGFEVLDWLRANSTYSHLPVVILTSSREDQDLRKAYLAGANSYFLKTPDAEELNRMAQIIHEYWIGYNRLPGH